MKTAMHQLLDDLTKLGLLNEGVSNWSGYLSIEKQQIIDAYDVGFDAASNGDCITTPEQYYNETFNK